MRSGADSIPAGNLSHQNPESLRQADLPARYAAQMTAIHFSCVILTDRRIRLPIVWIILTTA